MRSLSDPRPLSRFVNGVEDEAELADSSDPPLDDDDSSDVGLMEGSSTCSWDVTMSNLALRPK